MGMEAAPLGDPEAHHELVSALERRMGRTHARMRLGLERDHEAQIFGHGRNFFHIENSYFLQALLRKALKLSGLYWLGQRNAARLCVRENVISAPRLPRSFDGFTLLQISDLHVEFSEEALRYAASAIESLSYDICVLTGDYRALTYGPHAAAIAGLEELCRHIKKPTYAVLGNHDTILMVPELEQLGIKVLLNEAVAIRRGLGEEKIILAGVDDPHFFRADNLEKTVLSVPAGGFSILLSHTPELYRQAANMGFDVMLSGHTHGGQICLPGGIPLKLNAVVPRRLGAGAWQHKALQGYTSRGLGTSIVPVRFNCPPEITLHRLQLGATPSGGGS
jgi:uncharacterized protein